MLNEILKNWLIIVFVNWGHWLVVILVWSGPGSKYYEYIWILLCFSMWFSEFGYLRLGPTSILLHFLSCLHSVIKIWISLCMCLTLFHLGKDDFLDLFYLFMVSPSSYLSWKGRFLCMLCLAICGLSSLCWKKTCLSRNIFLILQFLWVGKWSCGCGWC